MKIRIDNAWSLEIAITETLRIQKKEDTKDKKNMLYIVVT